MDVSSDSRKVAPITSIRPWNSGTVPEIPNMTQVCIIVETSAPILVWPKLFMNDPEPIRFGTRLPRGIPFAAMEH